jgi:hypothetical protein
MVAHVRAEANAGSFAVDGPVGRTFTFADPDGYRTTRHDRT